ncbi:MAG: hypothetical protein WBG70_20750 [Spirulinaceae cyanobacterium]
MPSNPQLNLMTNLLQLEGVTVKHYQCIEKLTRISQKAVEQ